MCRCLRRAMCVGGMVLLSIIALAAPVDSLLALFDRKPSLERADAFFAYLYENEFTDEPRMYRSTPTPPMDTVKALVWYWAGEWYYATQQYPEAERNLLRGYARFGGDEAIQIRRGAHIHAPVLRFGYRIR